MLLNNKVPRGKKLADLIVRCAQSKKAERITLINMKKAVGIADWFVICQGDNAPHIRAIANAIVDGLEEKKIRAWHVEGRTDSRWILLDYSDVVAHVMVPEAREYYALEELWPGAQLVRVSEDAADER